MQRILPYYIRVGKSLNGDWTADVGQRGPISRLAHSPSSICITGDVTRWQVLQPTTLLRWTFSCKCKTNHYDLGIIRCTIPPNFEFVLYRDSQNIWNKTIHPKITFVINFVFMEYWKRIWAVSQILILIFKIGNFMIFHDHLPSAITACSLWADLR